MCQKKAINNDIYHLLGDRWYTADDDPVALLRQEGKLKCRWIEQRLAEIALQSDALSFKTMLDIGCGAGFLANHFAAQSYKVEGIDLSESSLEVARKFDKTASVKYHLGNAYELPFPDASFSIVTCMDFLEHVDNPEKVISEASRVLKPGGVFFYHTFNRTILANILVIKVVERFVANTPPDMHVYHLFLKPKEVSDFCKKYLMIPEAITGLRPKIFQLALWRGLIDGRVRDDFQFVETKSTAVSYLGMAKKQILEK